MDSVPISVPIQACNAYMHTLVSHVPEFSEMYGTIALFSQQGLEKLNEDYFRSTNHRDRDALKQMLLKLNRLEELTDEGCIRSKQTHLSTLCKKPGHNSRTCVDCTSEQGQRYDVSCLLQNTRLPETSGGAETQVCSTRL